MSLIIEELKSLVNIYFLFLVIAIGLFTFFVDARKLEEKKLSKEVKIARFIGLLYIIGGPVIFVLLKIAG